MSDQAVRRALLLDRDGVINVDRGYVHKKEDFEFIPGIFDLVGKATALNYAIIIITNQSGIGRGYYTEKQFHALMGWVSERFVEEGGRMDAVYYCSDDPSTFDEARKLHTRRKPNPSMIWEAARDFSLDLGNSILVGDKFCDIEAGLSAGVDRVFLLSDSTQSFPGYVVNDLREIMHALDSGYLQNRPAGCQ